MSSKKENNKPRVFILPLKGVKYEKVASLYGLDCIRGNWSLERDFFQHRLWQTRIKSTASSPNSPITYKSPKNTLAKTIFVST